MFGEVGYSSDVRYVSKGNSIHKSLLWRIDYKYNKELLCKRLKQLENSEF